MNTIAINNNKLFHTALTLSYISITFAFLEAVFSTYYGISDETLSLFGFGIGSLIEVVSAIGIAHMIGRIKKNIESERSRFERTALRITGTSFYILVAGLLVTCIYNIWSHHKPETTKSGIIIALISMALMTALVKQKTKTGKLLHSDAILADSECTKVCIYTSLILLASSLLFALTKLPYIDELGSLGIAYFSYKEGRECFEKARTNDICCCH